MQFCPPPGTFFHGKSISDTAQEGRHPHPVTMDTILSQWRQWTVEQQTTEATAAKNTQLTEGDKDVEIDIGEGS